MDEMTLVYEGNWHTYEEWGGLRIYEDASGHFYAQDGGYSVYSSPNEPDWDEPYIIAAQTALDLIDEWSEIERENELFWDTNSY